MSVDESSETRLWFDKAEEDHRIANILLERHEMGGAVFHLQQAAEKYLKGLLVARGQAPRRIHQIEELLREAGQLDRRFLDFLEAGYRLSAGYIESRYPIGSDSGTTEQEVSELAGALDRLLALIRETLRKTLSE